MSQELPDFFEGGGGGAPVISLKGHRKGTVFGGIVVPADPFQPDKAYATTQQTNMEREALYWAPNSATNKKGRTLAEFKAEAPNEEARPMTQAEFTLLTDYTSREFMSERAEEFAVKNEREDDGLRRWIVKGRSAPKALRDALTLAATRKPEVGSTITVTIKDKTKNGTYEEYVFDVRYAKPTPETLAKVQAYIEAAKASDGSTGGPDDEPPF